MDGRRSTFRCRPSSLNLAKKTHEALIRVLMSWRRPYRCALQIVATSV